ncbi:hypothetical protein JHD49_03390 [Sulfurimonas sp. SAG-AH-194-C21]|nr:hypothetical protein [Sulfurimonas sp. SAG-AH-194-C21]MDF1882973.1 hypothetical protein [Sulfurimonas sp. SAG-AH-194-C21]
MKKNILGILTVLAVLTGCGAAGIEYKKYGGSGWASKVGYSDFNIGSNRYKVSYTGSVNDDTNKVMKYTYKRAKELCAEQGFNDYAISNVDMSNKGTSSTTQSFGNQQFSDNKSQSTYSLDVECK